MADNASIKSTRSISALAQRMMRKKPRKSGSQNTSFFKKSTTRTALNAQQPRIEEKRPDQIRDEIKKKTDDKKEEEIEKKEKDEEVRQTTEKAVGNPIPNFDRDHKTYEPKKVEPKTSIKHSIGVTAPYAPIWEHEETDQFTDQVYRQYSFYTPNAYSLWSSLIASHNILANNEHLRWTCRHYMSFPVTLYYAVLFHIRVLQVRDYHTQTTESENKFFRRFQRTFKFNSLPIASFLIPFFNSVASHDPNDSRLTYTIPDNRMFFRARSATNVTDYRLNLGGTRTVIPDVPLLYDFWKAFVSAADVSADKYNENDNYIPHHADGNDWWLGYSNIHDDTATAVDQLTLASWGVDEPHPELIDKYIEASGYWKNSKYAFSGPAVGADGADAALGTIATFLRMDGNMDWFNDCIDMAIIHAKFFGEARHLSDLDVVQGAEIGIRGTLTFTSDRQQRVDQGITWYNRTLRAPKGTLSWYEEEIMDFQKYNFRHTMTNCSVTVDWSTHSGTARQVQQSRAFMDRTAGNHNPRYGPWYDRTFTGQAMTHHVVTYYGGSSANFDVFNGRTVLIRNNFYDGNPGK